MKRLLDLWISVAALVLVAPALILIAVAVKLSSPGPVLYAQRRVGQFGRVFMLLKFRTMVADADRLGSSVTRSADPRVTRVGRVLRRLKLDELPQLWNVLRGDMSLVGPRPDVPEIVAGYSDDMRRILAIRPGITGVASIYLANEEDLLRDILHPDAVYSSVIVPFKVRLAMIHVERQDMWFDIALLLRTVGRLIANAIGFRTRDAQLEELRSAIIQVDALADPDRAVVS